MKDFKKYYSLDAPPQDIYQALTTPVTLEERNDVLVSRLKSRLPGATIVYVTLQRTAELVAGDKSAEYRSFEYIPEGVKP